jgi:hypothetical protein
MKAPIVLGVALAALAAAGAARPTTTDPPRIVPWHEIGNVGIGMSHTRVEYVYGPPVNGNPPRLSIVWEYRGRGVIGVLYDRQANVEGLDTTSPAYATRGAIHVGIRIPLGRCHRVTRKCEFRWRGFALREDEVAAGRGFRRAYEWDRIARFGRYSVAVQLFVGDDGRVSEISLSRFLHCSWGDAAATTCKPPPRGGP